MAEKELAYLSYGIIIFIFIVFFGLLFYTLRDRSVANLYDRETPLTELNEEKDLALKR